MSTMYLKMIVLLVACLFVITDNAAKLNKRKLELWGNIVSTFGVVLQLVEIFIVLQT